MNSLLFIPEFLGVSIEVYVIVLIIAIPTFFIWRWILRKFIKDNRKIKIATWIGTLILSPLIYISIVLIWIFCISYYPSNDFDKNKWDTDKDKRYELSEDLIESNMLIGKTKAEVLQILGDEGGKDNQDYWRYYLGTKPAFIMLDPDVLDVYFEGGKVIRVSQHTA